MSNESTLEDRMKNWWKRFPWLYNFLFFLIGPSYHSGLTGKKFVQRFGSDARILHAGSGTKRLSPSCTNVDILPLPNVDVVADLSDLPLEDNSFDAATCEQVLEHVPHPQQVAQELERVVRPGGHIHIATPFLFPWHPSPRDYSRWTCEGLRELFEHCECIEEGVMAGPWSALNAFAPSFLGVVLSFGFSPLRLAIQYALYILLFPLKFLDIVFAHVPGAQFCAAGVYVVVRVRPQPVE